MAGEQLKLFTTRNALHVRFDSAFFRALPACAGVYLMCDAQSRVIYIGKAKNLRKRIGSYRYAHDRCSRKTARLVARVASIRWQVCASEEAALLEENRLLRELRPRFNRMNTWPKASHFVKLKCEAASAHLSLETEAAGECYGAFKGASRQNFGALLRLLWGIEKPYAALPRSLVLERSPAAYEFPIASALTWLEELRSFLRGDCDALMKHFASLPGDDGQFHAAFRQADVLAIEHFSRIGPQRDRTLRTQFDAPELIAQHELDDLLVRQRQAARYAHDMVSA